MEADNRTVALELLDILGRKRDAHMRAAKRLREAFSEEWALPPPKLEPPVPKAWEQAVPPKVGEAEREVTDYQHHEPERQPLASTPPLWTTVLPSSSLREQDHDDEHDQGDGGADQVERADYPPAPSATTDSL